MSTITEALSDEEMLARYKLAVERAIPHVPVKNGVVEIDSIWVETSIPYTLLREILARDDLVLPENVQRINTTSRVRTGEQRGKKKRKPRRRRKNKVRN
ncbi:hypothetical protein J7J63_05940 [Candidatus Bipolaricaulota bacterium]|nr:hypothetical protein [Candidatus Bipolaricaulota bacterium]